MPKRAYGSISNGDTPKRYRPYRLRIPRYPVSRNPGTRIQAPLGLPQKIYFKHKYAENLVLQMPSGVPAQYRFSCNSLYDPNSTGTGHQPYYFDEMANLYNQYQVLGSKITVSFSKLANSPNVPISACIFVEDDTSAPTDIQTNLELGRKVVMIGADLGVQKLENTWSAKRSFPGPQGRESLCGNNMSNPTEQMFYYITANSIDGTSTATLYVTVEIEYFTCWFEKKTVAGS